MKRPEMILFDYGHTLLYEPNFSTLNGTRALMRHAVKNPRALSPEQVNAFSDELYRGICSKVRTLDVDIHESNFQKLLYEYLEIEFSITPEEQERVFWENSSPAATMPNAAKMLDYLDQNGIRSGVISNIMFSGSALKRRIDNLLPNNRFEFILASSEYLVRKPHPLIFELALRKAKLDASKVWHCGDRPEFDAKGAHGVGIFPVWYHCLSVPDVFYVKPPQTPCCAHLYINDWLELIDILEGCEG